MKGKRALIIDGFSVKSKAALVVAAGAAAIVGSVMRFGGGKPVMGIEARAEATESGIGEEKSDRGEGEDIGLDDAVMETNGEMTDERIAAVINMVAVACKNVEPDEKSARESDMEVYEECGDKSILSESMRCVQEIQRTINCFPPESLGAVRACAYTYALRCSDKEMMSPRELCERGLREGIRDELFATCRGRYLEEGDAITKAEYLKAVDLFVARYKAIIHGFYGKLKNDRFVPLEDEILEYFSAVDEIKGLADGAQFVAIFGVETRAEFIERYENAVKSRITSAGCRDCENLEALLK